MRLTRNDCPHDSSVKNFDSIRWALELHARVMDTKRFNSAIIYGGNLTPTKIEFFESAEPDEDARPDWVWGPSIQLFIGVYNEPAGYVNGSLQMGIYDGVDEAHAMDKMLDAMKAVNRTETKRYITMSPLNGSPVEVMTFPSNYRG